MKHAMLILSIILFGACALFVFTGINILHGNPNDKKMIQDASELTGLGISIGAFGIVTFIIWIIDLFEKKPVKQ